MFEERDDDGTDNEEASTDETALAIQSDEKEHTFDYIQSRSGITYTSQQIPNRRRRRNILTQQPRAIGRPQTERQSFMLMLTQDILRTAIRYTNRTIREFRRTLPRPQNYDDFSMDEFQSGLAIFLRAGSDRNNFTELENLWLMGDSKPLYKAVMPLTRFKCFYWCIRFDNWHTREQRKVDDKFAAVSK